MRVRLQARSSLLQYHWSGYHSVRKEDLVSQTKEPPLADGKVPPVINTTTPPSMRNRLVPRQADGSHSLSGYRPTAPASFPNRAAPADQERAAAGTFLHSYSTDESAR